jgi:Tol biopolymer transport system component
MQLAHAPWWVFVGTASNLRGSLAARASRAALRIPADRIYRRSSLYLLVLGLTLGVCTPAVATVDLVSAHAGGPSGSGLSTAGEAVSADGRYVAFVSSAADLVPGISDTNETSDVFVRDTVAGTTTLVSVNTSGTSSGDDASTLPSISADGRFVAFVSTADDLAAGPADFNGTPDVYVRDLLLGITTFVSVNYGSDGPVFGTSTNPVISADGDFIAFVSDAAELMPPGVDTNAVNDVFVRNLLTASTTLVSINSAGTASGNADSLNPSISADGDVVAFVSNASDLVSAPPADTNNASDVYVRHVLAATTTLVSVTNDGTASGTGPSSSPVVSADGTVVAFVSDAPDLVAPGLDTPGTTDVFARDLMAATTKLVSADTAGMAAGVSGSPVINSAGSVVAFTSAATTLVLGVADTNGDQDVFLRDLTGSTTQLVSVAQGGISTGNAKSDSPSITADGQHVAFVSDASDIAAAGVDTNASADVFVRHFTPATSTVLVSINSAGTAAGNGASTNGVINSDGGFVAFTSTAGDLSAGGTVGTEIFERDLGAATTALMSVNTGTSASGNGNSTGPVTSADGQVVAFTSAASNLVAGVSDTNGVNDVFVTDMSVGTPTLVSVNSAGTASGNGTSQSPVISADGRFVAFTSAASDLVGGGVDANGTQDVYVRDLMTGTTTLVSINSAGTAAGNAASGNPVISADGHLVAFTSDASDLVATGVDANGTTDVFVRDLTAGTTTLVSVNNTGTHSGTSGSHQQQRALCRLHEQRRRSGGGRSGCQLRAGCVRP